MIRAGADLLNLPFMLQIYYYKLHEMRNAHAISRANTKGSTYNEVMWRTERLRHRCDRLEAYECDLSKSNHVLLKIAQSLIANPAEYARKYTQYTKVHITR